MFALLAAFLLLALITLPALTYLVGRGRERARLDAGERRELLDRIERATSMGDLNLAAQYRALYTDGRKELDR